MSITNSTWSEYLIEGINPASLWKDATTVLSEISTGINWSHLGSLGLSLVVPVASLRLVYAAGGYRGGWKNCARMNQQETEHKTKLEEQETKITKLDALLAAGCDLAEVKKTREDLSQATKQISEQTDKLSRLEHQSTQAKGIIEFLQKRVAQLTGTSAGNQSALEDSTTHNDENARMERPPTDETLALEAALRTTMV